MEKLYNTVDQVQNEDLDRNVKLLEWLENKFHKKLNERISSEIALSQVEMAKKIENVKIVFENIFSLYSKLCDPSIFTQETRQRIMSLKRNLKISSMQLPKDPIQSEKNFHTTLQNQKELAMLIVDEENTNAKLIQI